MEKNDLFDFLEGKKDSYSKFASGGRNFYQLSSRPFNMDLLDKNEEVKEEIVTPVDKVTGQTKSLVQRGEGSDVLQTETGAHLPSTSKTARARRNQKGRGKGSKSRGRLSGKRKTTSQKGGRGKAKLQRGGKVAKKKKGGKKKKEKKYTASFPSHNFVKNQAKNIFAEQS